MPVSALLIGASIASLNLCADEYLLLLARPSEIASLTYLSQDRRESPLWRKAKGYHSNRGALEQVLGQRPDIVLTMGGGGRATSLLANRLGLHAVDLSYTRSPADVARNLAKVATALGDPARATPWVSRLERLQRSAPAQRVDAIWVGDGGQSFGSGSAGARWLAMAGLQQRELNGDRVSLETLLIHPPAVLVRSRYRSGQVSRGGQWLDHPVLRGLKSRSLATDGRAWTCMGPLLIGEIERLRRLAK